MRGKTRHAHVVVAVWSVACDAVQVERLVVVLHRRRPLWRLHHVELVLTLHVLLVLLQLLCSATRVVSQKSDRGARTEPEPELAVVAMRV